MRQFVTSSMPDKKGHITLTEKEKRYLINVLRIKKGSNVTARLPDGSVCSMTLQNHSSDGKKNASIVLVLHAVDKKEEITSLSLNNTDFWLFQILPKGQKMDLIVRQATECGVSVIIPIIGEYSVAGKAQLNSDDNTGKVERWMRIVREAKQQSGSPINTKVLSPCTIETAMQLWNKSLEESKKEGLGFVLREKRENQDSFFSLIHKQKDYNNVCIGYAVGCEGGISSKELSIFQENNFYPIHFNTNILRAETAALYGLAILQTAIVEYKTWKELKE